jgi:hypothetical protein
VRAGDAGEARVEPAAVGRADHPLKEHGHPLFFEAVGRGPQVALGLLAEGGGVDPLHRQEHPLQPLLRAARVVGQHHGVVDAGERLVLGVFEQARRAHRQGPAHLAEERFQVVLHVARDGGFAEAPPELPVVLAVDREVPEVVLLEEAVEGVRAEDEGGGDRDLDVGEAVAQAVVGQEPAGEGEPPGLAAQRAAAEPVEVAREVEGRPVEVRHHHLALLEAVVADGPDEVPRRSSGLE